MNVIVERLGWTLVHSVWQFFVVALLAALAARGLRRRSANARYISGVIALGAVFALPCLTWSLVVIERQVREPATTMPAIHAVPVADVSPSDAVIVRDEQPHPARLGGSRASALLDGAETKSSAEAREPLRQAEWGEGRGVEISVGTESQPAGWERVVGWVRAVIEPRLSLLVAVWVVGVVLCSLRPAWGLWTQRRLRRVGLLAVPESVQQTLQMLARRMGLLRVVRIAESTLVRAPVVVGYLSPMILLPASVLTGLAPNQLEALLAHELAHVRRHDWLVNALQVLAETLFFFHPAVWWLSKRIANERELCCDDIALSLIHDKAVFARTLLILEELRQTPVATALAATDGDLVHRVSRLMPADISDGRATNRSTFGACLAAILALCAMLMLAFGVFSRAPSVDLGAERAADIEGAIVAKLSDGTVVELLGVSTGERDAKWWSADGQPLDSPPLKGPLDFVEFGQIEGFGAPNDRRSFAVRFRSNEMHGVRYETKIDGVNGIRGGGRSRDGFQEAITITEPASQLKTATVRVGLGEGVFGPPQGISLTGEKLPVKSGEQFSPWYDVISVASVGEYNNQAYLELTRVDQRLSYPERHYVEWSVVDTNGASHQVGLGSPSRPPNVDVTFDLPLSRVARFQYRLRPERQQWVTFENVSLKPGRMSKVKVHVATEIGPRDAEMQRLRLSGQAALERGEYTVMVARYQELAKFAEATYRDALWYGHALHLAGRWNEARDAYQLAISIADRRLTKLDQQIEPIEEPSDAETDGRTSGPVKNWILERDRERELIQKEWPQLVLLAGQVELSQLGDAAAAVKTLSRGMRFVPEAESLERLLEDAQKVASKPQTPAYQKSFDWMYPMATQRSLAQAYEKLGDNEAAARCWSRIQLSFLAYQVGMAFVDADHLVEIVSRVPADKRLPFHEYVLKNPGRPTHKRVPFAYQAALSEDKRNPFRVATKLDAFSMSKLGPAHANMVKLPNGRWLMAYTGGDVFQTRLFLSSSQDGTTWDAPWEFAHNNIFPAHSPSLVVDDDGTIWMLCTSKRFDLNHYSSGGFRLWLCSSRDGREWSPLRPINAPEGFQFQYQNTVQLTRDRRGAFWVFGQGQYASAKTPEELRTLQPLRIPIPENAWVQELHATFDANNRCHLAYVLRSDAIYRTSSLDMQNWTPPEKLAERREGSHVGAPQLLVDGDRIALVYETFSGHLRRGQFHGDEVTWSDPISIGLPLGGAALVRDGDRVLLPSGDVSAVAAPVLLEAKLADVLSPVGQTESKPTPPTIAQQSEWGPEHHGLRSRMTLMSNRTAVGQPLELKWEVQNVGTVPRTINQAWNSYQGLVVLGPDGKECEYIAQRYNGNSIAPEIKPGATRTLFELDIAPYFLIQTAGEHTLRLNGGPQAKVGDIEEGRAPIPPPNDLVVTLAPGELSRRQALFLKLRTLAPAGWRSNLSGGSSFVFNGDGDAKNVPLSEALIVHLWFSDTEFTEAAEKANAAKRSEPTPPIIRFGETDFGFGHLSVTPSVLRHWPKCVEQIRAEIPFPKSAYRAAGPESSKGVAESVADDEHDLRKASGRVTPPQVDQVVVIETLEILSLNDLPLKDVSHINDPDELIDQLERGPRASLALMTGSGYFKQPGAPPQPWAVTLWDQQFTGDKKLDPRVRQLINLGDAARAKVLKRLATAKPGLAAHLALVLRSIGNADAVPELIRVLHQLHKPDETASEIQKAMAAAHSPMTELAVTSALWELTGRKHVFTAKQWDEWWQRVSPDFAVRRDRERADLARPINAEQVAELVKHLESDEVTARERLIVRGSAAVPHLLAALKSAIDKPDQAQAIRLAWVLDELGETDKLPAKLRRDYFERRFSDGGSHVGSSPIDEDAFCRALSHCTFADFCSICLAASGRRDPLGPWSWMHMNAVVFSRRFGKQPGFVVGAPAAFPLWHKVTPAAEPAQEIGNAVPVLIAALNDRDSDKREMAAKLADIVGLCSNEKPEALIVALRDRWLNEPEPNLRVDVGLAMSRFESPIVKEAVLKGLRSERLDILGDAAAFMDWASITLNDSTRPDFERLVELTRHENDRVRRCATRSLAYKAPQLLGPEFERLCTDKVKDIREACTLALRHNPDPKHADILFKLADDAEQSIRESAFSSISNLNHPESMPRLIPHLRDPKVHGYAVSALASMGGKDALPLLMKELAQGNDVGGMIYQHLRRLTGEKFEEKPEPWLDWWKTN